MGPPLIFSHDLLSYWHAFVLNLQCFSNFSSVLREFVQDGAHPPPASSRLTWHPVLLEIQAKFME